MKFNAGLVGKQRRSAYFFLCACLSARLSNDHRRAQLRGLGDRGGFKISLVKKEKSQHFSYTHTHIRREIEMSAREGIERIFFFFFFKLHCSPEAPSGDKSYLYNATSSRSLINITVSFIAAKCPRVFEHEERPECGALNIRAAAETTRGGGQTSSPSRASEPFDFSQVYAC